MEAEFFKIRHININSLAKTTLSTNKFQTFAPMLFGAGVAGRGGSTTLREGAKKISAVDWREAMVVDRASIEREKRRRFFALERSVLSDRPT